MKENLAKFHFLMLFFISVLISGGSMFCPGKNVGIFCLAACFAFYQGNPRNKNSLALIHTKKKNIAQAENIKGNIRYRI